MKIKGNSDRLDNANIGSIIKIDGKEYIVEKIEETFSKKIDSRQIYLEPLRAIGIEEGGAEE